MNSNDIFGEARVRHVRELKAALAETKARLAKAEAERDLLFAHFHLGLAALRDFEGLPPDAEFRVIDGWNAILGGKNVSKLSPDDVSELKKEYLRNLGISAADREDVGRTPVRTWIVFDGKVANSFRSGSFRVTYTGGSGAHRADRMIVDYVNAAKTLGLDVTRIAVETADKDLVKRLSAAGVKIV